MGKTGKEGGGRRGESLRNLNGIVTYFRNIKKIGVCTLIEENFLEMPDKNGYIQKFKSNQAKSYCHSSHCIKRRDTILKLFRL